MSSSTSIAAWGRRVSGAGLLLLLAAAGTCQEPPALFDPERVWSLHLVIGAADWTAMEPHLPRPPQGQAAVSPEVLARDVLVSGDSSGDRKLSRSEILALAETCCRRTDRAPRPGAPGPDGEESPDPPFGAGRAGRREGPGLPQLDFRYVPATLEVEGQMQGRVAVRYKGNATFLHSQGSLRRSMKVDVDRWDPRLRIAGTRKINLHSGTMDAGRMNEVLALRLYREEGVPASRTSFAKVSVSVPGKYDNQYLGLYSVVENVDRDFLASRFGSADGTLFKPTTHHLFEDLGDSWAAYRESLGPKTHVSEAAARRVIALSKLVSHASDPNFEAQIGDFLEVDEVARFMAVTVWLSSMDSILSMGHNYVVYLHPRTGRFQLIPWDLDLSFGHMPRPGGGRPEQLDIQHPWSGQALFLERIFRLSSFQRTYRECLADLNRKALAPDGIEAQVAHLTTLLRPAIAAESPEELQRFDRALAGRSERPRPSEAERASSLLAMCIVTLSSPGRAKGGAPPPPFGREAGGPASPTSLTEFVQLRSQSVADQLDSLRVATEPARAASAQTHAQSPPSPCPVAGDQAVARARGASCQGIASGLAAWFDASDRDASGDLSEPEIRAGFSRGGQLPPPPPAFPQGPRHP